MYAPNGQLLPAAQWTGYFPDLIGWIANQSGMTYTLYAPTADASDCSDATTGNYGCGQKDVTETGVRDMYMGLYYVTPSRLEAGLMTRSFTGDAGIAVAQKGGATDTLSEYQSKQLSGSVGKLCTLTGAAFTDWVKREYPDIRLVECLFEDYLTNVNAGSCDAFVIDRPIALQMAAQNCDLNLGVGPSTTYGYHDCAFGLKSELTDETIALSYWIEWLRTCSPNDATDARCYGKFNLDTLYTKWGITADTCSPDTPGSTCPLGCGPGTDFDDSSGSCLITCSETAQGRNLLADELSPCAEKAAAAHCANAPSAYVAKINISFVLAGDASSFDSTGFKTALASRMTGVSSADIALTILASSVQVVAVITPPSTSTAIEAFADLQQLATLPPAGISRALGVTVQSITPPTYKLVPAASPPPPSPRRSMVLGIVLPVVLVGLSMLVLAISLRSRNTRKVRKGEEYLGQLELQMSPQGSSMKTSGITGQVMSPQGSSMKTSLVATDSALSGKHTILSSAI